MNPSGDEAAADSFRPYFLDEHGEPRLWPCAVLFLDLLSVAAIASGEDGDEQLRRFSRALRRTFDVVAGPDSPWPAATFSDSIVLAAPLETGDDGDPAHEAAIGGLLTQAAFLQMNLLDEGFVARGAIALGELHLLDGLLFGPGLVEAVRLESGTAVHPRVVLSDAVEQTIGDALRSYSEPAEAPQNYNLLRDADGVVFVDYLNLAFDGLESPEDALRMHRDLVGRRLAEHAGNPRVWEKYRWMADYHDAVCARREAEFDLSRDLRVDVDATRRRFGTLVSV